MSSESGNSSSSSMPTGRYYICALTQPDNNNYQECRYFEERGDTLWYELVIASEISPQPPIVMTANYPLVGTVPQIYVVHMTTARDSAWRTNELQPLPVSVVTLPFLGVVTHPLGLSGDVPCDANSVFFRCTDRFLVDVHKSTASLNNDAAILAFKKLDQENRVIGIVSTADPQIKVTSR